MNVQLRVIIGVLDELSTVFRVREKDHFYSFRMMEPF